MTRAEFDRCMSMLENAYRDYANTYNSTRLGLLWCFVQDLLASDLEQACMRLIEDERVCPLPMKFKVHLQEAINRDRRLKKETALAGLPDCAFCQKTGMISADKRGTRDQYAFRCPYCTSADVLRLSRHIPAWNVGLELDFERTTGGRVEKFG